jgi:hypothetical protein
MTTSELPGQQLPEDDTALLTAALDHAWAWYSGRISHANQVINFYIVATAVAVTAYASSINDKHYDLATALAIAGLGLTAITSFVGLYEVSAAGLAEPALTEMQERIGSRLKTSSMGIASRETGLRLRLTGLAGVFGVAIAFDIAGLAYALSQ